MVLVILANRVLGRVGRKGELFPPKQIREAAGLRPSDLVAYTAENGKIEVVKVPTLREAFKQRKFAKISFKEFEEMTHEVLSNSKS